MTARGLIRLLGLFVAVLTGTVLYEMTTYAVLPSGLIAMASGPRPTLIGVPGLFVAVLTGVTVLRPELAM